VLEAIDPRKDVDGFHPVNVGRLVLGLEGLRPCTPAGVQELLLRSGHDPAGKHVVVAGRSNIVGKPVLNILLQKQRGANAVVTLVHTGAPDLARFTREADILIAAIGKPEIITAAMVKPGVVVIDVGINRIADPSAQNGSRLVGDVEFASVREIASAITPVPGGVGPMTIAMLMHNTLLAAEGPGRSS
jgi:methylenetetrahydrofolate dehydrogenase (NADP+)/methenyltetrahydrofolate cyclohydrolase